MATDWNRVMRPIFIQTAQAVRDLVWQPAVDIYRTSRGWLLKYELAGVRPEDIELIVKGPRLTVRGKRRDWRIEETCICYQMEITYSHFERTVELPEPIEAAQLRVEHREGMLLVRIHQEGRA
jgi:HSP20 family protein